MTKKHFIAFAKEIAALEDRKAAGIAADIIIKVARADNPRFDTARFLTACKIL